MSDVGAQTVAIGTVAARNYLSFARVLAASLRERHPDLPFFVVVADDPDDAAGVGVRSAQVVRLAELGIPNLSARCQHWSCQEMAVAVKPFLLQHLLDRGFALAVFLDPDTLIVGDLQPVLEEAARHPFTLVPHLLSPPGGADRIEHELTLLRAGTFNAGFVGAGTAAGAARPLLRWWQDRVLVDCSAAVSRGVYYDQRWLDLAPALFEGVHVLRDPGCNVAYWNLTERRVTTAGDEWRVNGGPARFIHFSGFDPREPSMVSRHVPGLTVASLGEAGQLFDRYAVLLREAGALETAGLTWGVRAARAAPAER